MIKVNSSQFNYRYRHRAYFPYSIAMLVSHIKTKEWSHNFKFEKTFCFRDRVEAYIQQCKDTDILLCSCYVWNWEITTRLAKEVKKLNPGCTVIFGGPQVPGHSEGFFEKYPFVDIVVRGEGEYIIANLFEAYLRDKNFSEIKGIETKSIQTPPEPRIIDLDALPSPYLSNLMWDLVDKEEGLNWMVSWETNRGCPYQCTFCDWGSLTNSRIRKFSMERLLREVEWFSDNKISFVYCCDANFGIYQERDLALATKMKEEVLKKGFPEHFRPAWAKFSSEKIIPIAKQCEEAGILCGVTLALQSMDETTLKVIKRENMKFGAFAELTSLYRVNGIPTYTEIILGLPGETLESFKRGLETIAEGSQIGVIYIYNCGVLPNAPMNEPAYRERYHIKTLRSPIYLAHSSIHHREMPEYENIVIGTISYCLEDLKQMYLYGWLVQTFYSFGVLEYVSKYYKRVYGVSFAKFNETLLDYCREVPSLFSEEYQIVLKYVEDGYEGKGWDHFDPRFGDLYWAIEEASWLRFTLRKDTLSRTLDAFAAYLETKLGFATDGDVLRSLVKFQVFLLTTRDYGTEIKSENFDYDWKDFFSRSQESADNELKFKTKKYSYRNQIVDQDPIRWGWEAIWFGRGLQKYKFNPVNLRDDSFHVKFPPAVREPFSHLSRLE